MKNLTLSHFFEFIFAQPTYLQWILMALVVLVVLVIFYLLFSLLFSPLMYLFNWLTNRNESNTAAKKDYLIGKLTLRIEGQGIGEVMEVGSQSASSVYPAKLYRQKEREENLLLKAGTKVLIIDFDEKGRALVVRQDSFL